MNLKLTANPNGHRPRLRVVLPLLLVCFAVIFFSIQDRLQERTEHSEGRQNYSGTESGPAIDGAFRQIPQRRVTLAPQFSRDNRSSEDDTPVDDTSPESDEAEAPVRPDASNPTALGIAPIATVIVPRTSGGTIAGHVTLNGMPPPERDLPLDPSCARLRTDKVTTRFFVVDERGGVGDVVIALAPVQNGPPLNSPIPVQLVLLDQIGCEFVPYVLGLQVGQRLLVRNSDPVPHNVHLISSVPGAKEFNRAQRAGSPDLELTFEAPELFLRVKCDVHVWMFAYVSIFDHGFFAVTQSDGSFQLANVPPGDYMVVAAHRRLPKVTKPITVQNGETSTVDFLLDIASLPSP